ncbi:GMC oxidoreductase [Polyporus arcularius HHB13444]|uniref:GMC oxidoreductase n=1 Tax=Polyporus arcularius HHB13444 TaxID=1314778 RepID=A0A5C3P8G6_9APHY|nr:GMC oxidoreductase [Polyporus arcularius HHB13444]
MTAHLTAEQFASTTFDYIIAGGGTAGLTLAARLVSDAGLAGTLIGSASHDWGFSTVPQKYANGKQVPQPRGKGLGGCSLINIVIFDRGSAADYDAIEALGNPGWDWNGLLSYFKKSETALSPEPDHTARFRAAKVDSRWHGDSGPIVKSYARTFAFGPLLERVIDATAELGVPFNGDSDDGNKIGMSNLFTAVDSRTATRSYAGNAYFEANADRKNLFVLTSATVSRITFRDGSSPLQATGIEFLHGGKPYYAAVHKEVILSAGSLKTPQILELSGIGDEKLLRKFGITTLVDLPSVGENLLYEIDPKYETLDTAAEPEVVASYQQMYETRQGPLASSAASTFAFIPSKTFMSAEQQQAWKDSALSAAEHTPSGLKKQYETQIRLFSDRSSPEAEIIPFPGMIPFLGLPPTPKTRYMTALAAIMHPLSRGTVHITSADPTAAPAIDPSYFSRPEDLDVLLASVKFSLAFFKTGPLADVVRTQAFPTPEEACSDDALKEYIKNTLGCVFHPVGTASMLPKEDGGVVDSELRVYGTANVRVVDASILPLQIAAHTQATVYAIAEKAADIIRGL